MPTELEGVLKSMSLQELLKMRDELNSRITRAQRSEKTIARKKILELARLHGVEVSFAETGKGKASKKSGVLSAKYKNPENPQQTWSGHGRKPAWLENQLNKGRKLSDFEVLVQVE